MPTSESVEESILTTTTKEGGSGGEQRLRTVVKRVLLGIWRLEHLRGGRGVRSIPDSGAESDSDGVKFRIRPEPYNE